MASLGRGGGAAGLALLLALAAAVPAHATGGSAAAASFNRDIRPILVKNCIACHGDVKHMQGDVLLRTFEDATGATGHAVAIKPGDAAGSPLYRRITAAHEELRMPPPETKKSLTPAEVEAVRGWIDAGARYEQHWAYLPVRRPVVPQLADAWVRNPVDAFLLRTMRQQGLAPSPVAEPRELVRRLWLDLHGLVPSHPDIQAHAGITRDAQAHDALVDELLASPQFGERMAVPWLDWVKYSDETSDRGDYLTPFYPYRNYVIRAFNENLPFDRFTVEQLAGDLLPNPTVDQRVASGFNHLIVRIQDGVGVEAIHKYVTERVDKVGQVWLASSLQCAQCHDHKFDPWSQKQYYQFAAFFADLDRIGVWTVGVSGSSTEPRNPDDAYFKLPRVYVPTPSQKQQLAAIETELAGLREQLDRPAFGETAQQVRQQLQAEAAGDPDYFKWIDPVFTEKVAYSGPVTTELTAEAARPPGGNGAIVTGDIQYLKLAAADQRGKDYRLRFTVQHDQVSALQLRVTRQGGDHYSFNRPDEVAIGEVAIAVESEGRLQPLRVASVESTDLGDFDEGRLIDGDTATAWRMRPRDVLNKYRYERKDDLLLKTIHNETFLVFYLDQPLRGMRGRTLQVTITHRDEASRARAINLAYTPMAAASPFQKHVAGPVGSGALMRRLRQGVYDFVHRYVFFTDFWDFTASQIFTWMATNAGVSAPVPFNDVMKSVLATVKERYAWDEIFRDHVVLRAAPARELGRRIRDLERRREKLWGEVERSWTTVGSTRSWPIRVLKNGQISDTSGERVGPGLPAFLGAPQGEAQTRLDLARWLVAADNPLTARVMVNRIWRLYMGSALVPTLEEFGSGGAHPSHPELLDWLAAEFIDSGWDVKHLVRLIVTSAAYRQSSLPSAAHARIDPQNRYFARQGRFQIDAEFMQDYLLRVSGLLREGLYGEHTVHDDAGEAPDRDRRSLYLLRKNIDVQPELRVFGAKPREKSVIHRPESITPMQALASLNQPLVMRAAGRLADDLLATSRPPRAAIEALYLRVLQRRPQADERAEFERALAESRGGADREFWIMQARTLLSLREATLRT